MSEKHTEETENDRKRGNRKLRAGIFFICLMRGKRSLFHKISLDIHMFLTGNSKKETLSVIIVSTAM